MNPSLKTITNQDVSVITDYNRDKYSILEQILEITDFFPLLEDTRAKSGKSYSEFCIAIKPNLSMMLKRSDDGTYTDPALVIHLLRLLIRKGYTNLMVVESQNIYGNWFNNRTVRSVANCVGLIFEENDTCISQVPVINVIDKENIAKVPLIDLSNDVVHRTFDSAGENIALGKSWIEADFRISFAKLKSHSYYYYTSAIKNIFGCLPHQNKCSHYHANDVVGTYTALMIKNYPVHFSIVDAYTTADGWVGVKMKAISRKTCSIIAGTDILAVDYISGKIIGEEPDKNLIYTEFKSLMQRNNPVFPYAIKDFPKWNGIPFFMIWASKLLELNSNLMDYVGSMATGGHESMFTVRKDNMGFIKKILHYIAVPFLILCDISIVVFKARYFRFYLGLKIRQKYFSTLLKNSKIKKNLHFLTKESTYFLISCLDKELFKNIDISGNYLLLDDNRHILNYPLFLTNIAVFNVLKVVSKENQETISHIKDQFINFLKYLDKFGDTKGFPYCLR